MSKFHLFHCVPHRFVHGLHGYKEVIDSVAWGLSQLGHEVSYALNSFKPSAINIIFGAQVLPVDSLKRLPANSIVYNFEQMRGLAPDRIRPEVKYCAQHFRIWDYSRTNFDMWKVLGVDSPTFVPVGYAPVLTRIPKANVQDIDVLIYGLSGDQRLTAFHRLSSSGLTTLFASGLYGEARDTLIARSRIVLNINRCDFAHIFEIVRVSYLFANRKAVVATLDENTTFEEDVHGALKFTTMDRLVDDCVHLLTNERERERLENAGFEVFSRRDVKQILAGALVESGQ